MAVVINKHDIVELIDDLPEEGLKAGEVGTVVHVHENGDRYDVQFMSSAAQSVTVTASVEQLRAAPRPRGAHSQKTSRRSKRRSTKTWADIIQSWRVWGVLLLVGTLVTFADDLLDFLNRFRRAGLKVTVSAVEPFPGTTAQALNAARWLPLGADVRLTLSRSPQTKGQIRVT